MPQKGERITSNGITGEWDGTHWIRVDQERKIAPIPPEKLSEWSAQGQGSLTGETAPPYTPEGGKVALKTLPFLPLAGMSPATIGLSVAGAWGGEKVGHEVGITGERLGLPKGTADTGGKAGALLGAVMAPVKGPGAVKALLQMAPHSRIGGLLRYLMSSEAAAPAAAAAPAVAGASAPVIDDVTKAVLARFPGISEQQAATIAARAVPNVTRAAPVAAGATTAAAVAPEAAGMATAAPEAAQAIQTATQAALASKPTGNAAGALMRFGREAASRNPKLGEKIWVLLDEAGLPLEVLTPGEAGAAARAGKATTWIKNIWQ